MIKKKKNDVRRLCFVGVWGCIDEGQNGLNVTIVSAIFSLYPVRADKGDQGAELSDKRGTHDVTMVAW